MPLGNLTTVKKEHVSVFILIISLIIGTFFLLETGISEQEGLQENSRLLSLDQEATGKTDANYWKNRIQEIGADQAYFELKAAYAAEDFGVQHLAAHIFGEILYEEKGLGGLQVCDGSFAFGCYHSFFGFAVAKEGIETIAKLDELCIRKFGIFGTGCQHGLGHGVLEYIGHDRIRDALEICKRTQQVNPLFGCTSGVFMEYYTPIVLFEFDAKIAVKPFEVSNPYGVCGKLGDAGFRLSCYYELGHWWQRHDFGYAAMGQYCAALYGDEREVCFQGIADAITVAVAYDVSQSVLGCQAMPNSEGIISCRSGIAWTLFAEPKMREKAGSACNGLFVEQQKQCLSQANLICNRLENFSIKEQCYKDNRIQ